MQHPRSAQSTVNNAKQSRLFLTDVGLLIAILGTAVTGLILWLATGHGPGANKIFMGWTRIGWGDLHLWFSMVFLGLTLWHFWQHWNWVRNVAPRQAAAGGHPHGLGRIALTIAATLALTFALFGLFSHDATQSNRNAPNGRVTVEVSAAGQPLSPQGRQGWRGGR